jgi:protein-L-isoaspartate(D-aspartate) O-methyltransferase
MGTVKKTLSILSVLAAFLGCGAHGSAATPKASGQAEDGAAQEAAAQRPAPSPAPKGAKREEKRFAALRERMVREQLETRDITDKRVLEAMRKVPRHRFVPSDVLRHAYADNPLPIGLGQTISQPYIVAFMTEALELKKNDVVLEIGTGSGYQAAVLSGLVKHVYTIEILCELADRARETLRALSYENVTVRCGDGYGGWPERSPFDAVIVTAAPPEIPQKLVEQLKPGGRMVLPVGRYFQSLQLIVKREDGSASTRDILPVRFVPMVHGKEEKK